MSGNAFVYTELQLSLPFARAPWRELNPVLLRQPGLRNKTWLAGVGNDSIGGFYEFDSLENARRFVVGYFPGEAGKLGAPQTTRLFDGAAVAEASRDLNSPHFGGRLTRPVGAFVYTEVQAGVPFVEAPWRKLNPVLRSQPGFIGKTWLSGVGTRSLGGFYAFDSVANATRFAVDYFPTEMAAMETAFTARVFDALSVEEASRPMRSPFFA